MTGTGWEILLICLFACGTLFFSVNAVALRTFSYARLQEAFKTTRKKEMFETLSSNISENADELVLACWLYRLIFNMCILLALVDIFLKLNLSHLSLAYFFAFIIALIIFSAFSLAILS